MNKNTNMIGLRYGRLLVIEQAKGPFEDRTRKWFCKCDCGNIFGPISTGCLNHKRTNSCGCLNHEKRLERCTKHGLSRTRFYRLWFRIKQRCYCKNRDNYERYGGRGIYMHDAWINDPESFIKYITQLEYSDDETRTLDRIDNEEGYIPGNLRFATLAEQAINKRSTKLNWELVNKIREMYNTGNYSQTQIAKDLNLSYHLINTVVNNISWKKND